MKRTMLLAWTMAFLLATACTVNGPVSGPAPINIIPSPSLISQPTDTPTPTATPSPSPTPTAIPLVTQQTGEEALWNGDYDSALRHFQQVLDSGPEPTLAAAAHLGAGKIYAARGKSVDALNSFRSSIDLAPQSLDAASAHFHMGRTLMKLERYGEAAESFARYLEINPGKLDSAVAELRGDALVSAGDYEAALVAYQFAENTPRREELSALQIKMGYALQYRGDWTGALDQFQMVFNTTSSDLSRAQADHAMGQALMALGRPEEAYLRYQDTVTNYPRTNDAYQSLVVLINNGVPVDDLSRGLVDYYAGQYSPAIDAFDRYAAQTGYTDGTPLHYKALILRELGSYQDAISTWQVIVDSLPADRFWPTAWEEIADTYWLYMGDFQSAADTLLAFVAAAPYQPQAGDFLFQAARNLERAGLLEAAAGTWARVADEYPAYENSFRALFFSGVSWYRLGDLIGAKTAFQRGLLLSSAPGDLAAAYYWIGKVQAEEGDLATAEISWQQATLQDPTGYYSERARDRLAGRPLFDPPLHFDLGINLDAARMEAESWVKNTFGISPETNLEGLGDLTADLRIVRGGEYWRLGLYEEARNEFEDLRQSVSTDPSNTYRLANYFFEMRLYRSAILAARQVLTLAGLSDEASLNAPEYFNHIRFLSGYRDLILNAANEEEIDPLLLFSVIRQESLFEGFIQSSAGARGLMQIMPATGDSLATNLGWPPEYTTDDLYRPAVSIRLGARYLAQQIEYFEGNLYKALAAYNGGPGNTMIWSDLAGDDPDLFLEVVRIQETRTYIMRIYEIFNIYRRLNGQTL